MTVRLTPKTGGDPKRFDVASLALDTAKGELTLTCRDGKVCLGLVGAWDVAITDSARRSMSCDDVERIHDGRSLVLVN